MNNAELIMSLRYCFEKKKTVLGVPWYVWCDRAADALEAQQKALDECAKQLADMAAKVPKEGEWMARVRWYYQQPTQSATTNVGTTSMCRSTGKMCQNATEYGYCKQTACNNCGARMKGEQG